MFNTNVLRIEAIDIARGISVIIMIMVHALWMYATKETQANSILGDTLHFLGKGTAAFLVLMGFSMSLSRRQNASQWALRGVLLLLAGFALNALKFIVPIVIFNTIPDSFIAAYGWQQPLGSEQYTFLLLTGDILTFAGISLMLMALAFPLLKSPYGIVVSLVLILSLTGPLRGLSSDVPVFGYLLELLFADNYQVYFPVFPWITCILFGLLFGRLYCIWDKSIDKTFKLMAISGALLMTLGLSLISYNFHYHFNNFFHLGAGGALYLIGINGVGLWLIHKLLPRIKLTGIKNFLRWSSERVTSLYVIQWTLICWGMGIIGFQSLNSVELTCLLPLILAITFVTQWIIDKASRLRVSHKVSVPQKA